MWDRSMRRGRPAKMIDQSWFGPTISTSLLVTLKTCSPRQAVSLSRGDRQRLYHLGCSNCLHRLGETPRTVGVSKIAIGRIDAMCFLICPLRDPARTIKGSSGLVSNESAETTDGEQWPLFRRSERGFMSYLNEQCFNSHTLPPSFIVWSATYSYEVRHRTLPRQSHDGSPVGYGHVRGGEGASFFMLVRLVTLRAFLMLVSGRSMMRRSLLVMVGCLFCHGRLL
jgi:hypothetical protein